MAITTTTGYNKYFWEGGGGNLKIKVLNVTGLTAAANNTIPHGLTDRNGNALAPQFYVYGPEQTGWSQQQAADNTNVYITVATAGATAGTVILFY